MINKFKSVKMFLISVALLACSFTANSVPTPTPTVVSTSVPTITATPRATSTPFYKVEVGKTIAVKSGGFSFSQINGYKAWKEDNTGAYLANPDRSVNVGVLAYPRPSGATLAGLMSNWRDGFKSDFDEVNFAEPVAETKGDISSLSVAFTGIDKKIPMEGRLTIYEPQKAKLIYLYTIAYGDQRWQREGQQVFETTAGSIKLFTITALENCPTTKNENYGYRKTNPIKIGGGGEQEGSARIANYLNALLGRKGEIVSYNTGKADSYAGIDLDVYLLRIGNDHKGLYFDTSNFEELSVPYGLSCSAPLPGKPDNGTPL
ncbi:MAG: hypothetical protein PHQ36_01120 [Anaerolineales bacterium]|nr:hypothetical protein [Anaerolineales bacterium]